jgi:hypothetical protein
VCLWASLCGHFAPRYPQRSATHCDSAPGLMKAKRSPLAVLTLASGPRKPLIQWICVASRRIPLRRDAKLLPSPARPVLGGFGRGVAQPGRASALGAEGRRFNSCRPDQLNQVLPRSRFVLRLTQLSLPSTRARHLWAGVPLDVRSTSAPQGRSSTGSVSFSAAETRVT